MERRKEIGREKTRGTKGATGWRGGRAGRDQQRHGRAHHLTFPPSTQQLVITYRAMCALALHSPPPTAHLLQPPPLRLSVSTTTIYDSSLCSLTLTFFVYE